jgi:hypothetical protein
MSVEVDVDWATSSKPLSIVAGRSSKLGRITSPAVEAVKALLLDMLKTLELKC